MKNIWRYAVILLFTACANSELIYYDVAFESTWSADTHPDSFPSNAHWSALAGVTHNAGYTMWTDGAIASDGMEQMAEKGGRSILFSEFDQAITAGTAEFNISGWQLDVTPGLLTMSFPITESHPYVSLVTMVAPSPDWFTGVSSVALFENGRWVDKKVITLYAYDAGTDSGAYYTAKDIDTSPRVNIQIINTSPFFIGGAAVPVGTFTFTRK